MSKHFGILNRLICITYLISLYCTLLSIMLSIKDKKEADIFNIIDIISGSVLLLVLTYGIRLLNGSLMGIYIGISLPILAITSFFGFLSYNNANSKDYIGVCIFLRIVRIISVLGFIIVVYIKSEELYDY